MTNTKESKEVTPFIAQLIIRQLIFSRHANFSWNCFLYIFSYHSVTDRVRSVHDALICWCRIQDLLVLIWLPAGYKNTLTSAISNIIHNILTFKGLSISHLCHRNFSFVLQPSVILHFCRPEKQRQRSILIARLRPFLLTFLFCMAVLQTGSAASYEGEILDSSLCYGDTYKLQAFACLL